MDTVKLEKILNEELAGMTPVGGGCIADSQVITTKTGKKYFLKQGFSNGMFENEANGLKELSLASAIRVPGVIAVEDDYLVLEHVEQGTPEHDFFKNFGQQFALLHQYSSDGFGFYEDNFIGSTPQKNRASDHEANSWADFYWNKRLMFQLDLAQKNGHADKEMRELFADLENKYTIILKGSEEPPSLLHGDLWSGNYMSDESGKPVLIDPAVYYGHREADLAMTKLFGGFSSAFYEAYNQTWPLEDGYEEREPLYLLYHVMNHLNLFGAAYYYQAIKLLKTLVR